MIVLSLNIIPGMCPFFPTTTTSWLTVSDWNCRKSCSHLLPPLERKLSPHNWVLVPLTEVPFYRKKPFLTLSTLCLLTKGCLNRYSLSRMSIEYFFHHSVQLSPNERALLFQPWLTWKHFMTKPQSLTCSLDNNKAATIDIPLFRHWHELTTINPSAD